MYYMKYDNFKKKRNKKRRNIKVSIITPCLNSEKTIRQTIESVLNQTYCNIEYILIDGGSKDATIDIIKEYQPRFEGRLRYVSEPDKGIYDAMNKGIKMSRGELIGIINSDDFYEIQSVERAVRTMTCDRYQVIYGYLRIIERSGVEKYVKITEDKLPMQMMPHPTCFVTRQTYIRYGLFLTQFKIAADYELILRFFKAGDVRFVLCPSIQASFRAGGTSSSNKTALEQEWIRLLHGYGSIKTIVSLFGQYILKM